jgi:hypothetical protein
MRYLRKEALERPTMIRYIDYYVYTYDVLIIAKENSIVVDVIEYY